METFFYWVDICEHLKILFFVATIIAVISLFAIFISLLTEYEDYDEIPKKSWQIKIYKPIIVILLISSFGAIFIPSKKTLYLMKGVGLVEEIMQDEKVKQLPDKTIDYLNALLDKELKKNKKEE